jgi:hypothetical protein
VFREHRRKRSWDNVLNRCASWPGFKLSHEQMGPYLSQFFFNAVTSASL